MATDNTKIFVSGLALKTKDDSLRSYFQQFGEVEEAVVVTDSAKGTCTGYGFVTVKDPSSASIPFLIPFPLIDGAKVKFTLVTFDSHTQNTASLLPHPQPHHQLEDEGIIGRTSESSSDDRGSHSPHNFGPINSPSIVDSKPNPSSVFKVPPQNSSLFGPPSSLFGVAPQQNSSPFGPSSSLFGAAPQQISSSLFGVAPQQISSPFGPSSSLFGVAPPQNSSPFMPIQKPSLFGIHNAIPQKDSDKILGATKTVMPFKLLEMAKNLQLDEPARNNNFVFSPCSIQLALSLVANGSKGSTLKEFLTVLDAKDLNHLNGVAEEFIDLLTGGTSEGGGPKLSFVGGVWIDKSRTLTKTFEARASQTYRAKAKSVDFLNKLQEVIDEVNRWAEEATNGLIKDLLPPAVLANAIYFKGTWSRKFDEHRTRESAFYLLDGSSVAVPFMSSYQDQHIRSYEDFKILRLPYKRDVSRKASLSMYIILPNRDNGIWHLIKKIGSDPSFFDTYVCSLDHKVEVGELKLPKFKMTYNFDAHEALQRIGLKLPFSGEAEFDEMVEGGGIGVSKVIHKAYIEVNEEGTEAAAATAVVMASFGAARLTPPVTFVADHPFVFMVRDDSSGMILFMGHVINPLV